MKEDENNWDALAEKQLASIKRDMRVSLEDAAVRATHKVMAELGEEHMKEEWLLPGAFVPVDVETTAALVAEIKRLIDVVGGMALARLTGRTFAEVHPPNLSATCDCEHWQSCVECHPTAHPQERYTTDAMQVRQAVAKALALPAQPAQPAAQAEPTLEMQEATLDEMHARGNAVMYEDLEPDGTKCLITSAELARKYHDKINVPIYIQATGVEQLNEADELLKALRLDPNTYRTDGGWLNIPKICAAIKNPHDYPHTGEMK
tara:strand:+ start:35 stop:820 length:786 start_codon:yes stop_codon:yes gene_type:complete